MHDPKKSNRPKTGITSVGAYIPRLRLSREAIAEANAWANPGLRQRGKGVRAICSHDEDSLTMAVAAARAARTLSSEFAPTGLQFASTTLPFADRQNASIIADALSLPESLSTTDVTGSLRCATTALITSLNSADDRLIVAADKRKTRPASSLEMTIGDAAAAIETGSNELLAVFLASHSLSIDLTDHYREAHSEFDYQLEDRWVRDEGHLKIIPRAINHLLQELSFDASEINHFIVAGPDHKTATLIADRCGIPADAVSNNLALECGHTGCPHPFLMLIHALESAQAGEKLLVIGFGQGCDALLFEATELVDRLHATKPVQTLLDGGVVDSNYQRYLSFNHLVELDWGMRAERDNRTAQSAFFRHRKAMTGFIGGRCEFCGTAQFPSSSICVNPDCRRPGLQADEPFSDKQATVKSYTEDWLAHSYNPPFKYGNVRFEGGGVVMMEFADFSAEELVVGAPVSMQFRIKDEDSRRGFKRYFWKAAPIAGPHNTIGGSPKNG